MDWQSALVASANDPRIFVAEILKETAEPWQTEAWAAIADGWDRLSIRSGHGVGKTFFIARTALWFILTRGDAKCPIAANTQDQLRDTIWPELRAARDKLPEVLRERVQMHADRVTAGRNFIAARTINDSNPEGLQGFHAQHLCFLIDEASGLPDIAFDVARGALSTPGALQILTGNPTRTDGYFYRTHNQLSGGWFTMRVNSEDVPRARGHIGDIIADYGERSNQYRVRVLGEFPEEGDDVLIPLSLIQDAVKRDVHPWDRSAVWGVDVARFGDDRSALAKRRGNHLLGPVKWWHGNDLMQSVGHVVREWRETPVDERPSSINVDVIGMGAGVVDRLREQGLPVSGVNVGERPVDADSGKYLRRGDELWHAALEWFRTREVSMPDDPLLISELSARRYVMESTGKLKMEPKPDMKKRGLKSPDIADAFILTFAGGDYSHATMRQETAMQSYDEFHPWDDGHYGRQQIAIME